MAARYLTAGKWALAKIAAVQLRIPDLPDAAAVFRLRKAEDVLRFNPNHYPAGSGRGGQFAPSDQSAGTINVADSSADDITRRKFGSDEDAARSALKHFYEASKRAGAEYGGVIYRAKDSSYGITAPTTEKGRQRSAQQQDSVERCSRRRATGGELSHSSSNRYSLRR